jgi:Rnl2 family RNA ligase
MDNKEQRWDDEEEEQAFGGGFGDDLYQQDDAEEADKLKTASSSTATGPAPISFFEYPKMDTKGKKSNKASFKKEDEDDKWVVLEKVHGCNFSFICNGAGVQCARRTALLSDGETFYSWQKAKEKYVAGVLEIYKEIEQMLVELDECLGTSYRRFNAPKKNQEPPSLDGKRLATVTVFGELFGGIYPHPDVPDLGLLHCQKGVYYTPDIEFYAFDIYVKFMGEANGFWLNYRKAMQLFAKHNFFYARPLFEGPLQECLKFDITINSSVPALLGLPPLEKNQIEGVVIKSVEPSYGRVGKREIYKHKNAKFAEVNPKVPLTLYEKKRAEEASNLQKIYEEVERYITDNRMDNLRSKIGEIEASNRAKVAEACELLCADVLADFCEDERELWEAVDEQQREIAKKNTRSKVNAFVADWLERHASTK